MTLLVYASWFALGTFFGIVCTYAWTEFANARSMEDIIKDMENS